MFLANGFWQGVGSGAGSSSGKTGFVPRAITVCFSDTRVIPSTGSFPVVWVPSWVVGFNQTGFHCLRIARQIADPQSLQVTLVCNTAGT